MKHRGRGPSNTALAQPPPHWPCQELPHRPLVGHTDVSTLRSCQPLSGSQALHVPSGRPAGLGQRHGRTGALGERQAPPSPQGSHRARWSLLGTHTADSLSLRIRLAAQAHLPAGLVPAHPPLEGLGGRAAGYSHPASLPATKARPHRGRTELLRALARRPHRCRSTGTQEDAQQH
uniref:Uncharacterized protein n=1 Tax=Pipistrellus kuhlii TaxID=59472 RepID=A0A7J7RTI0_PIPKU|nr:hypothetical protein mPipKuh1_010239 [Pipistrellus kuhlii]